MGYTAGSFTAGQQPTTSQWNVLWTNDASFNDGTGIANSVITANKLATGAAAGYVATGQTTTSTSYTDLATTGPTVTVTIGVNGLALVAIAAALINSVSGSASAMTFAVSGANTIAAADLYSIFYNASAAGAQSRHGATFLLTGLAAGSTTFTCKYNVNAGTGTFADRRIAVVPL